MSIQFNRADYMANKCSHREYYRQFVNDAVLRLVETSIGRERILASADEHLNDIPLRLWDRTAGVVFSGSDFTGRPSIPTMRLLEQANGSGGVSVSDCVCTLKAAAQMIKEKAASVQNLDTENNPK